MAQGEVSTRSDLWRAGRFAAICVGVFALLVLGLVSCFLVWIPDIFADEHSVCASYDLESGGRVELRQFWNRVDFYTMYLHHETADGQSVYYMIDPDSGPVWFGSIRQGADQGAVDVVVGGALIGTYFHGDRRYHNLMFGKGRWESPMQERPES